MNRILFLLLAGYAAFVGGLSAAYHVGLGRIAAVEPGIHAGAQSIPPLVRLAGTRATPQQRHEYWSRLLAIVDGGDRVAFAGPEPNVAGVYEQLRARRPHPGRAADAFQALGRVPSLNGLRELVDLWREADEMLSKVDVVAPALYREVVLGRAGETHAMATELGRLGSGLSTLERRYAEQSQSVAAILGRLVERALLASSLITLTAFAAVVLCETVRLRRGHATLRRKLLEVVDGTLPNRIEVEPSRELTQVVTAFNQMVITLAGRHRRAQEASHEQAKALRELTNIMETIPDVICILDMPGRLDLWNRNLEIVTGLAPELLQRRPLADLFCETDRPLLDDARREGLRHGRFELEAGLLLPSGEVASYHWTGAALEDERGALIGFTVSGRDVTERKALQAQMERQAFHDVLTGLPNRALFMNRLAHALSQTGRTKSRVAVVFLDLDRFKVINDSLGHRMGDELLIEVGRRVLACVRPADTVARLGGDEFAVLLPDVTDENMAIGVADRIASELQRPFTFGQRELVVTSSVGIAVSRATDTRPEDLLRNADLAMYRAKNTGKARHTLFDGSIEEPALERLDLEIDLRGAVGREEFVLYYQPVVRLDTGVIEEVEALVRWDHPHRGLLAPAEFIGLAEETGLIIPLGQWVLQQACRQARHWEGDRPVVVAVNLSARQFQQPDVVETVAAALRDSGLPPTRLKLEITESVLMNDGPATIAKLKALKTLGVQLAIDDFGTGYSSLGYLKRFPVDVLKVDKSFVKGLGRQAEDIAIVRAVIAVAKSLSLSVTAEGVETVEQVEQLAALGCDCGQGFLFAHPLPDEQLHQFLAASHGSSVSAAPLALVSR